MRHAKSLQSKMKAHTVEEVPAGFFVRSASSGNGYLVNHAGECCCRWSHYHDTTTEPCSHVLAVVAFKKAQASKSVSVWATEDDAERQHRRTAKVGEGLWMTER
jgi:hypothetical protein